MHAGSGPRYVDWSHLHVPEGERDAAAPYIPAARKLLGFVMDEARRTGLKSHKIKRTLRDGTVIIAEKIGDIPRMTIVPKGGKPPIEIRVLEGFFFPRRVGIETNHQGAILVEPDEEAETDWKALFYGSEEVGFDLAPDDRRGTYIDVFGTKAKEPWKRLETAGGMWVDQETKEAVTWFRGYLGYWPMHYRHPVTNYAPYVSIYGHQVYATPFPEWRVLAAAKRDMWLYVLVCENLGALSPPERPAQASEPGQVWCSQPYTDAEYVYSLRRYPLAIVTQPDTLIDTYKAGPEDTAEVLWSGSLTLAYGAWSFNADCTSVVTIQLPRICVWTQHMVADEDLNMWVPSIDPSTDYPSIAVKRIALNISHGIGTPSVTYAEELAPTTIAEEDGTKLELVLAEYINTPGHPAFAEYSRMEYQCDGLVLPAFEGDLVFAGEYGGYNAQLSRTIVYAHIPSRTFLFLQRSFSGGSSETVVIRYELYVDGEEVEITDDPFAASIAVSDVSTVVRAEARQRLVTPWIGVFDPMGNWTFKQDYDSMTFLLGITFDRRSGGELTDPPASQAYFIPCSPYIPFTARLNSSPLPEVFGGAIDEHAGAGGWSVAKHGGPAPFDWDDGNEFAQAAYFNKGQYLDPAPSSSPFFCPFGGASQFDGDIVFALKVDPWTRSSGSAGDNPYPFHEGFYPLRYATNGDARELIDAIDNNRLANDGFMFYASYPIGHTGAPMKRQKTRFAA